MANFYGPMLLGVAKGFQDYQQGQEDLQYTRQLRTNQLQQQQLANQSSQLQLAQQQQAFQDEEQTNAYAKWAAGDAPSGQDAPPPAPSVQAPAQQATPSQQGQQAAAQATPGNVLANTAQLGRAQTQPNPFGHDASQQRQAPAGGAPMGTGVGPSSGFKLKGPLTAQQYQDLDAKNGLPPGTMYGVFRTESNENPNAVNPTSGAVGIGQVLPSTAANPGFGLKPGNARDPEFAAQYMGALYKKFGGNLPMTLAAFDAGPGNAMKGNINSPETRAYVPKVMKAQQEFVANQTAEQAAAQPSPADHVDAAERAGADVPLSGYTQAVDAQQQRIGMLQKMGQKAMQDGNTRLAGKFFVEADQLTAQRIELQGKAADATEKTNKAIASDLIGVHDQATYNTALASIAKNPFMRQAMQGLGLSGNWEQDRNKLGSLVSRTETLKDIQDQEVKRQRLDLDRQKEQREQAKQDAPRVEAEQQRIATQRADEQRRQQAAQTGLPYVPSLEATAPVGTSPKQIADARKTVDKKWETYDKGHETQRTSSRQVMNLAGQLHTMIANQPDLVGGWTTTLRDKAGNWALSPDQQILVKSANAMVVEAQKMAAPGAQRSAATAAYARILATTKPNITMSPDAALKVANDYFMMSAAQAAHDDWLDRARTANPDATPESLELQWRRYERSLGPSQYFDPKTKSMIPNNASISTLPDGTDNSNYRSPDEFFAHEGSKK